MAKDSAQKKVSRIRAPRVHITYEVDTGDAIEQKELPFVMGVLGDFTGQPKEPLSKLKERSFTDVTLENFNSVMEKMQPHLAFTVENKLTDEGGKIGVDLTFESLDDFSPDRVARKVEPLRELLDLRDQLADLRGKLQGNDRLEDILQATLSDQEKVNKLKEELNAEREDEGDGNG